MRILFKNKPAFSSIGARRVKEFPFSNQGLRREAGSNGIGEIHEAVLDCETGGQVLT